MPPTVMKRKHLPSPLSSFRDLSLLTQDRTARILYNSLKLIFNCMSNHSDGRERTKEKQYSERTRKIALKIHASFLWVQESYKIKAFKSFQVRKIYAKY